MKTSTFLWLTVIVVLWFIPGYARQYFEYSRDMQRIMDQRASLERQEKANQDSLARTERMIEEATENTKKTNAEWLRLMRTHYGLEKAI